MFAPDRKSSPPITVCPEYRRHSGVRLCCVNSSFTKHLLVLGGDDLKLLMKQKATTVNNKLHGLKLYLAALGLSTPTRPSELDQGLKFTSLRRASPVNRRSAEYCVSLSNTSERHQLMPTSSVICATRIYRRREEGVELGLPNTIIAEARTTPPSLPKELVSTIIRSSRRKPRKRPQL